MEGNTKLTAYLALASVSFFWGTTYFAIRIGVSDAPPFLFSGIRNAIAGLLLTSFFLMKDKKLPSWGEIGKACIPGFFMILLSNGLVTFAEQFVPSGLTAL
ncbi:MAG: EamA family transporter, partial [Cytophagales bacterium]|nr:EamA family transporter [Cytophagales bacterium]